MTDEESPEVPVPLPEVPRGKLWTALSFPPVITFISSLMAGSVATPADYNIEYLYVLPVGLIAIIIALVLFIRAWRVRYHGRSLVLTSIGFFLGQIILCLSLWFGCCMLIPTS